MTPCVTRLERLLAALYILPEEQEDLKNSIKLASKEGINFLLKSQVSGGKHNGGFPRSIFGSPAYEVVSSNKRDSRSTEIRVDYVQHALSALLQYRKVSLKDW